MVLNRLKTYGELVMFSHTLFSLPFTLISMLWAAEGLPDINVIFWIIMAFIGGRTGANAINRLIDKNIDSLNPRTSNRHLPKNIVKNYEVVILTILSFSLFILSAFMLNPLCVKLLPLALVLFIIYSYTKRFTWTCHIILGIACGGAPVGAWIAVTGEFGLPSFLLGAFITLWVAGFDIIYATQDVDFDKNYGLFSIPVRFGIKHSLYIAAFFHFIAIAILFFLYFLMNMGWLYLLGVVFAAVLLIAEHLMVSPENHQSMKIASYSINQIVSITLFIFTTADFFI